MAENEDRKPITKDDPAFAALGKIITALDGFDRPAQLRVLAATAILCERYTLARSILTTLEHELAEIEAAARYANDPPEDGWRGAR